MDNVALCCRYIHFLNAAEALREAGFPPALQRDFYRKRTTQSDLHHFMLSHLKEGILQVGFSIK